MNPDIPGIWPFFFVRVAYRRKKFALLANFFRWQFYSCYARKVVRLGLRNFPLKQTKVTLVS